MPSLTPIEAPDERRAREPVPKVPWSPPRSPDLLPPRPVDAPKRRIWLWVILSAGATVVLLFVALAGLGAWLQSQPVIDDDMADGDGPFVAESDPHVDLRYEDGGYVMDLTALPDGNLQIARSFWQMSRPEIDFSITYELREVPAASADFGIGVGCVGSGGTYWLALSGDGSTSLSVVEAAASSTLEEVALPALTAEGRLRIVCEDGVGDGPTVVTGYVDGERALDARHPNGFGSFRAVGLIAGTGSEEPLVVVWDDAFAD